MTTHFATRERYFRPSAVRSVFDISMAKGMVSFAGGNPDISQLPLEHLGDVAARLIREHGLTVLQYGASAGLAQLRGEVAKVMALSGIDADADEVVITCGSQMGLEVVTAVFCNPGDVVLAGSPTYVGAITTFAGFEADIQHVPCDGDGIIPDGLQTRIRELKAAGKTLKFLYVVPNFNNPSGTTLAAHRRPEIIRICTEEDVLIVEDDPYGLLRFDGTALPAMRAMDDRVIYLGSMSKIFSPGIRVGWVLAPADVLARLRVAAEATTIHAPILSQYLAYEYLHSMDWRAYLRATVKRYADHANTMLERLRSNQVLPPGSTWTSPDGGFFVWATLPEGWSADALLKLAVEEKVVFVPGTAFYANGEGTRNVRLSYSMEPPERILAGLDRLAAASSRLAASM